MAKPENGTPIDITNTEAGTLINGGLSPDACVAAEWGADHSWERTQQPAGPSIPCTIEQGTLDGEGSL
ncbi:hypothetical protein HY468_03785 [Candidatus Roizmanbacteria bacterium]|nr:hypothetical protein [Candidatus Roizmanbacteria bacterium]